MFGVPVVIASAVKAWDGTWLLTVKCPFCRKPHTHGGGDGPEPGRFGVRVSHCRKGSRPYDVQGVA
jgi:hypothetical protein